MLSSLKSQNLSFAEEDSHGFRFYASAILLGCSLLSHRDYACSEAGQNLIVSLFSVLPDIQKRREILSNLLERIEDQSSLGSTAVLQVLRAIGARHPSSLYPFKTILDQLIDYMEFFSTNDIRILYQFMCLVHLSDEGQQSSQLEILIQKQLFHPESLFKRIGCIGAACVISHLGKLELCLLPSHSSL